MQAGNADRSRELESNRYKETGKLISICMPPCMGKTIAAVFLRLSAASVKGFLSWLLLSALLLQLSEPVSDALLFGRSWRSALLFHLTLPFGKMAELFQRDKSTISRHIKNVFSEGELQRESVVANFATTAADGKTYQVD